MVYLLMIFTHEYTHDNDDYETHDHDKVFFHKFHDVAVHDAVAITRVAMKMHAALTKVLGQDKKKKGASGSAPAHLVQAEPKVRAAAAPRNAAAVTAVSVNERKLDFLSRQMSLFG